MAGRIQFGDETGLITNRMCLKCWTYVYECEDQHPDDRGIYWYLCLMCDERLLPIECVTQGQLDDTKAFVAEMERTRFTRRQEQATKRKEAEQQSLWEL